MPGSAERYRIKGLLGRGGMAEVFEAHAVAAGGVARRVAIKRLLPGHEADPASARMFLDEARIASHLHHGAIVGLLDYGVLDGQPFQVLELVDGLDAATLCRLGERAGAPLPAEMALHLAAEVALALRYAHEARDEAGAALGVVHRDVKPSNILVSWNGDVKLGDFGIASALGRAERTLDGGVKGTPAYMGPEQLRGDVLDGRADLFALGCALHALLCGSSPLVQQANVRRLLRGEALVLAAEIGAEEAAIIARAVQVSPADRHATAGEMAEALGELLARRIARSPRSILLDWLARVRPHVPPRGSPRARLDALLGLDLQAEPTAEGARRFVTRTVQAGGKGASREGASLDEMPQEVASGEVPLDSASREVPHQVASGGAPLDSASGEVPPDDVARARVSARDDVPGAATGGAREVGGSPGGLRVQEQGPIREVDPTPNLDLLSASGTAGGPRGRRRWAVMGAVAGVVIAGLMAFGGRSLLGEWGGVPPVANAASGAGAGVGGGIASAVAMPGSATSGAPLPSPTGTVAAASSTMAISPLGGAMAAPRSSDDGAAPVVSVSAPASAGAALGEAVAAPAPTSTSASTSAAATGAPEVAGAPSTGVMVIRGAGSVGAEIRVDGGSHGFAPKRLELPLGNHSVVLILRDGTRLGPRAIAVTARNTRSAPAAWDVAAP